MAFCKSFTPTLNLCAENNTCAAGAAMGIEAGSERRP